MLEKVQKFLRSLSLLLSFETKFCLIVFILGSAIDRLCLQFLLERLEKYETRFYTIHSSLKYIFRNIYSSRDHCIRLRFYPVVRNDSNIN